MFEDSGIQAPARVVQLYTSAALDQAGLREVENQLGDLSAGPSVDVLDAVTTTASADGFVVVERDYEL